MLPNIRFVWLAMMVALLAATPLMSSAYAASDSLPEDKRIKILRYDPNDIYTIYTLYGYQTSIELSRNERIQTISVGDRSLWQIVPSGYRMFIRPLDDNVTTNMTVITDRRTYQFDLKSGEGTLSSNPRMVYVARFSYPKKPKKLPPQAVAPVVYAPPVIAPAPQVPEAYAPPIKPMVSLPPAAPSNAVELERYAPPPPPPPPPSVSEMESPRGSYASRNGPILNYDYTYTGPDSFAPSELYDDGKQTYIRIPRVAQKPTLYALSEGKKRQLVHRMEGDVLVVNSVNSYMLLDYGSGENSRIYLYNELRMPAGL